MKEECSCFPRLTERAAAAGFDSRPALGSQFRRIVTMVDREKVKQGLEHCINESDCRGCVYFKQIMETAELCQCRVDALALLKEQETVLDRLRSTMEDMIRGNAPEEVSYLLSLINE